MIWKSGWWWWWWITSRSGWLLELLTELTRWSRSKETEKGLPLSPSINPILNPSSSCYLLSVQANKIIGMCSFTLVARQWLPGDYLIEKKKMPPLCFDSTIKKHKQGQLFNYSITQTGTLLLFYDFVVSWKLKGKKVTWMLLKGHPRGKAPSWKSFSPLFPFQKRVFLAFSPFRQQDFVVLSLPKPTIASSVT